MKRIHPHIPNKSGHSTHVMQACVWIFATTFPAVVLGGELPSAAPQVAETAAGSGDLNVRSAVRRSDVIPPLRATAKFPVLPARPALPEGVTDISFDDFFRTPVGPRGLEFTDKLKALDGKRVRIAGFQVAEMVGACNADPGAGQPEHKEHEMQEASVAGRLILCATPESVNFSHYGLCEDLPPQVVFITVPDLAGKIVPQHHGPLLVTGILEIGNKAEPDGRVSTVRLVLDPQPAADSPSPTISAQAATVAPNQPTNTSSNQPNTTTK